MSAPGRIEEDYAGPGGWEVGFDLLGIRGIRGYEKNATACATAEAAGFTRHCVDVRTLHRADTGDCWGYIASCPCPPFSKAGKRLGVKDIPRLYAHIDACRRAGRWIDYEREGWLDEASTLIFEVVRAIFELRPVWIALEQVVDARPLYEALAELLRSLGWAVWVGVLDAEMYGVPQTRDRLILLASCDPQHNVSRPPATHQRYGGHTGPSLFGDELPPPVTMAEALGWGLPYRPSWTVSGGGTRTGGAEPFANAASRRELRQYARVQTNNDSRQAGGTKERFTRTVDAPSPTITGSVNRWRLLTAGAASERTAGSRPRPLTEPASTITGKSNAVWVTERPATTVQADPRIAAPGHRDRANGERQFNADTVTVTVEEAACLQSFPVGYPWQGNKGEQFQQVGDAMPPLLAVACGGHLLGITGWQQICRDAYRDEVAA